MVAIWTDADVTRYMGGPRDREQVKKMLDAEARSGQSDDIGLWPVIEKATGDLVGDCGLTRKEIDGKREVELIYVFAKRAWGRGYATEAAAAIRDYAFHRLDLQRLVALIDPANAASERVAVKIGLRFEKDTLRPDGTQRGIYVLNRNDMTMASEPGRPGEAPLQMLQMLNTFLTVQALHVAAALGIADRLADGSGSVDDLANATGAHRASLYRLLRMLAGAGVFREQADGRFALTPLGGTLRSEGPDSVRDWAVFVGAPEMWEIWGGLRDSVMTGEAAFSRARGMALWDYMAEHPELGTPFDRWMSRQSDQHNAAIVASYDFSPFRVVADIGGGQGSTLAAILRVNPSVRGILLDLPHVVARPAPLETARVADRCEVIGGDMLAGVPGRADAYIIKRVLMDWGDEQAARILRNCAGAMPEDGKVLVVEMVLPPGNEPSPAKAFDVLMLLVHAGARIRTKAEFGDLFAAAGLRLTRVIPTASPNSIVEGVRA